MRFLIVTSLLILTAVPLAQADEFGPRFMSIAPYAMVDEDDPFGYEQFQQIEPAAGLEDPEEVQTYVKGLMGEDMNANDSVVRRNSDQKSPIIRIYAEPL